MTIAAGTKCIFNSQHEEQAVHNGLICTVERVLTLEETDEENPMYLVKFASGVDLDAFEDELTIQ